MVFTHSFDLTPALPLSPLNAQKRKVSLNRIVFVCQRISDEKRNIFLLKYAHKHILCCCCRHRRRCSSFVHFFSFLFRKSLCRFESVLKRPYVRVDEMCVLCQIVYYFQLFDTKRDLRCSVQPVDNVMCTAIRFMHVCASLFFMFRSFRCVYKCAAYDVGE